MRILTPAEYRVVPWRNGRGTTTELVIEPLSSTIEALDFDWRVSMAPVLEGGTFSLFPGFDRLIAVIEGDGMTLRSGSSAADLRRFEVFRFSGDVATVSSVPSPLRDFNVIFRRSSVEASLEIFDMEAAESRSVRGDSLFLHVLAGALEVDGRVVSAAESCQAEGAVSIRASRRSSVALVVVEKKDRTH